VWSEFGITPHPTPRLHTLLALALASLWTLHPLQTESVTYIVQRAESLCGLFYLATLYCVIRGAGTGGQPPAVGSEPARRLRFRLPISAFPVPSSAFWNSLAVLSCLLGMATKEVMVTAPLMVLLYDRTFLAGTFSAAIRRRWPLYLGLAATWGLLGYLVLSTGVLGKTAGYAAPEAIGAWEYLRSQPSTILHYLRLAIWPQTLCLEWGLVPIAPGIATALPAAVVAALLAITVVGLACRRGWAILGAWIFMILAPTSLLPLRNTTCEHRMYLPLASVLAAVVLGANVVGNSLVRRRIVSQRAFRTAAAFSLPLVCLVLALLTFRRNVDYRSGISIWEDTVAKNPLNHRVHYNLGVKLMAASRINEAIAEFGRTIDIQPDAFEAHVNWAEALLLQGKNVEAVEQCRAALRINPKCAEAYNDRGVALFHQGNGGAAIEDFRTALQIQPDYAEAEGNWGITLAAQGRLDEAIEHAQRALNIDDRYAEAHNTMGAAEFQKGRKREGIVHFRKAVEIRPNDAYRHVNLGDALHDVREDVEAVDHCRIAIRLQPDDPDTLNKAAWVLATAPDPRARDGKEAVEFARRAAALSGQKDPAVLDTLAAAYAEAGRFSDAIATARQAAALAKSNHNVMLTERTRARLKIYEASTPYRDLP
jgi:tetratricopeptide (TPR) repeat protein